MLIGVNLTLIPLAFFFLLNTHLCKSYLNAKTNRFIIYFLVNTNIYVYETHAQLYFVTLCGAPFK